MPLILAIEPDKKQASQLTAMVRGRLHAEFVLGDTAERALAALGQRVPDLILTSPLLSPKDEAALGERLRALDGAAAHVQTLTTPVLATTHGRGLGGGRASGVLSALRRDKTRPSAPEGCDPGVFAEQCREYLERADTERQTLADQRERKTIIDDAPAVQKAEPVSAPVVLADAPAEMDEPVFVDEPIVEAPVVNTTEHIEYEHRPEPVVERRHARFAVPQDDADGPASLLAAVAALAAEEDAVVVESAATAAVDETVIRDEQPMEESGETVERNPYQFLDLDLSEILDEPGAAARARRRQADEDDERIAVYELDPMTLAEFEAAVPHAMVKGAADDEPEATLSETELYTPLALASALRWPMMAIAGDMPRPKAAQPDEMKEWLDIIEALRRDAAQQVPMPRAPMPPSPENPQDEGRKARRRPGAPQDEWGFFDPEQCGFQALLAKLEEISDQDDVAR